MVAITKKPSNPSLTVTKLFDLLTPHGRLYADEKAPLWYFYYDNKVSMPIGALVLLMSKIYHTVLLVYQVCEITYEPNKGRIIIMGA